MSSVEWNKKEELVAEQALKHLKVSCGRSLPNVYHVVFSYMFLLLQVYASLFAAFTSQSRSELTLIVRIQVGCVG